MTDYDDMELWGQKLNEDSRFALDHLAAMDTMVRGTYGKSYCASGRGQYLPENHYFSHLSGTVPGLIYTNPRISVETRRPGSQQKVATAMRHGLNRWIKDENLVELGTLAAVDFCYNWAVVMVSHEPDKYQGISKDAPLFGEDGHLTEEEEDRLRPRAYRVPQKLFFCDSRALAFSAAEHMGHDWFAMESDIQDDLDSEDNDWIRSAAEALFSEEGSQTDKAAVVDPSRADSFSVANNPQFAMKTIWVPGLVTDGKGPDEGYNGSIITLGKSDSGMHPEGNWRKVKETIPFFGPDIGPYEVFGAYYLPDKLWPMSSLVAVDGHIKEVNRQAKAISRANLKGKQVTLYDQKDRADATRVKNAQSDYLVGLANFDKAKYASVVFGFANDAQYKGLAFAREQLQRDSAQSDAAQGQVTGIGTATENNIAAQENMIRRTFLYNQFAKSMNRVIGRAGHYLYYDDRVKFPLGGEVPEMADPWFEGGLFAIDEGATYADLELEIEAYSMGLIDQARMQASVVAWTEYLLRTAPMRAQAPWIDWDGVDQLWAQNLNMPELAGLVDNQAAVEAGPFEQGSQELRPMFSRDAGPRYDQSFSQSGGRAQRQPPTGQKALGLASSAGGAQSQIQLVG